MEEVIDLIATDSSASEISDKLKDLLFTKAAERVDALRPGVSNSLFDGESEEENIETEPQQEEE
jgi:hypothetical protein